MRLTVLVHQQCQAVPSPLALLKGHRSTYYHSMRQLGVSLQKCQSLFSLLIFLIGHKVPLCKKRDTDGDVFSVLSVSLDLHLEGLDGSYDNTV